MPGNPLLTMDNVILTAHVASASARFDPARRRRVGHEISLVLNGRWPRSCVNPTVLNKRRAPPLAAVLDGARARSLVLKSRAERPRRPSGLPRRWPPRRRWSSEGLDGPVRASQIGLRRKPALEA